MQTVKTVTVSKKKNGSKGLAKSTNSTALLKVPVAQTRIIKTNTPKVTNTNGRVRVRHTEYIADVSGSVAFNTTKFVVNPGNSVTFPWLSKVAQQYESYLFHDLRFEYQTQSATSATGMVVLSMDYDALDASPVDKVQARSYANTVKTAPWQNCTHVSDVRDMRKRKTYYVSSSGINSLSADVSNLFVCTSGQAGSTIVGELYAHYDVELMTPQLDRNYQPITGGSILSGGTVSAANPLGTVPSLNTNAFGLSVNSSSTITFTTGGEILMVVSATGALTINTPAGWSLLDDTYSGSEGLICLRKNCSAGETVALTVTGTITSSRVYVGICPRSSLN